MVKREELGLDVLDLRCFLEYLSRDDLDTVVRTGLENEIWKAISIVE